MAPARAGLSLTSAIRTDRAQREIPKSGTWEPKFIPWASLQDPSGSQTRRKESACKDSPRLNLTPLSRFSKK